MIRLEDNLSSPKNNHEYFYSVDTLPRRKRSFYHSSASIDPSKEQDYIGFITHSLVHPPSQPPASIKVS